MVTELKLDKYMLISTVEGKPVVFAWSNGMGVETIEEVREAINLQLRVLLREARAGEPTGEAKP